MPGPPTLDYRLFIGMCVLDIVVPRNKSHAASGDFSSMSKSTKEDVLHELMEVSKTLQATITSSTIRKNKVDDFIMLLTHEECDEKEDESEKEESGSEEVEDNSEE
ncbi:unnamed protein product [Vicia faba]|uniref:Uncharacterized protein n=1 Tax=Vicia faba TaxID=3906 RepID=A0AAV0YX75_VICFA|nr:unnamed protein product [Vicia faba]